MEEALVLFESVISLPWFKSSSIVLLLTKSDLFEEKILSKPIRHTFSDYKGDNNDSKAGQEYFANRFLALNQNRDKRIEVVCANLTSTQVFEPVMQTIMNKAVSGR